MKKILSILAAFFLVLAGMNNAFAKQPNDVPADYWAVKEINAVLNDGIMSVDKNGKFLPQADVTRAQFTSMLLRGLGHPKAQISSDNKFTDVTKNHWAYGDILLSENLGLVYGYPDKTFKPNNIITKSEAASVISHITKNVKYDVNVLKNYKDANSVYPWVKNQYAKSIAMNIYVNYPDADKLLPNKDLNRAEAAVLLYKLKNALNLVQEKYVAKEVLLSTEHLDVSDKAPVDEVKITNLRKIVLSQNLLKVYFEMPFRSKGADLGEQVNFVVKEDIYTKEGTLVIPKRSTLVAVIDNVEHQKIFNKNAKVTLKFCKLILPCGQEIAMQGRVLDNDGVLTPSKWATFGKVSAYTLGGAAVGTGAGVGFAAIPSPKKYGNGVAIGLPVGAGVGLATGLITPGLTYKADENDSLLILITSDLCLPNK